MAGGFFPLWLGGVWNGFDYCTLLSFPFELRELFEGSTVGGALKGVVFVFSAAAGPSATRASAVLDPVRALGP